MQSAGGDIVTVLDADIQPFKIGIQEFANEAKRKCAEVNQTLQTVGAPKGGGAASGLGRTVQGIGFAMQDFSSVLSMGGPGALQRALSSTMNNVQMLGAAFGPTGMAITAVGGALGAMLIPKLIESESAFDRMISMEREATERMYGLIKASQDMIGLKADIGKMTDVGQIGTKKEDLGIAAEKKQAEMDALIKRSEKLRGEISNLSKTANEMSDGGIWHWVARPAKSWARSTDLDPAIKSLNEDREKIQKKIMDARSELVSIEDQKKLLDKAKPQVEKQREDSKTHIQEQISHSNELLRREKERQDTAAKIAKDIATPYETAIERQRELQSLLDQEIITRSQFDRASQKNREELVNGLHKKQGKNEMLEKGSARAYDAIRESQKGSEAQDAANKFLERIAKNTDKMDRITDLPDRKREIVEIMA